ncbi:threonine synthase [Paraflavitalea pollutisoli]|uniref:threonine synthase n=1 Tax=Paraflavitalea pollutisoli TaxID=3034143 RepID=UPI0023ECB253|nr:threonine synthase [Paraflavitalea sp. H1-2-19X]
MRYFSLNKQSPDVGFKEATLQGQAPDKGLYFPDHIPVIEKEYFDKIEQYSNEDIAFRLLKPYVEGALPDEELARIVGETINFPIPLEKVREDIYSLELFHGPTLAFKDVGARFMSRCLGYFARERSERVVVLVATSGDTGGAVAHGFYDVPGVDVVILYPSGKVSSVQEKQLTTLGKNIHALEVTGSFDDCQQLVKQAFTDAALTSRIFLTSANSINVARWLPQQIYYLLAWKQWKEKEQPPVICVPSGNFGNICAGLLAHRSGLPASHFIAACNANDVVTRYLQGGDYQPQKAVPTLSNAMDVGNPSNFVRILELFNHEFGSLSKVLSSASISDEETKQTIRRVFEQDGYLTDPHGAVGLLALERYLGEHQGQRGFFLETAHPVKFYDVVEPVIGTAIPLPPAVQSIVDLEKQSHVIAPDYEELSAYLRGRYH